MQSLKRSKFLASYLILPTSSSCLTLAAFSLLNSTNVPYGFVHHIGSCITFAKPLLNSTFLRNTLITTLDRTF
jgi:hypothetical protein